MLANATGAVVAALFDDHDLTLRLYPVPRDRALEAAIRKAVAAFWRREREGEEHPVHRRDNPAHTWPVSDPSKTLDLSQVAPLWHDVDSWDELLARREESRVAAKTAEEEKKKQAELVDAIDHRLKIVMKTAEVAFTGKYRVSWKTGKRARTLRVRERKNDE
jgi:predicted phage-related endonuclease